MPITFYNMPKSQSLIRAAIYCRLVEVYFANVLYNGFIAANTPIIAYQYQSKLSSGFQSFAKVNIKPATLSFIN